MRKLIAEQRNRANNTIVKVYEYERLQGSSDIGTAQQLYFMQEQNMRVREVEIMINKHEFAIEPGAMSYFSGDIDMVSGLTMGNVMGRYIQSRVTSENMATPVYRGTGKVVLEPTFRHIILMELENESIVVDKGMFYGAESSVKVKPIMQKNLSSAFLGKEGIFQIELAGTGLIILESPVPENEIIKEPVKGKLRVDGNFALLRRGNLDFRVEQSGKGMLDSVMSGEGLVNTFTGEGEVWLAPTLKVYQTLEYGIRDVRNMDMNTSHTRV